MKLKSKNYKNTKIKNYLKKNNMCFIFFFNNSNVNFWLSIKQNLKILGFQITSNFKNFFKKSITNSVYLKFKALNSHFLILLHFKYPVFNFFLNYNLDLFWLKLLAVKLNKQIYTKNQLKKSFSLSYTCNKFLLFQFKIINFKKSSK